MMATINGSTIRRSEDAIGFGLLGFGLLGFDFYRPHAPRQSNMTLDTVAAIGTMGVILQRFLLPKGVS